MVRLTPWGRGSTAVIGSVTLTGCAPTVDVLGVYFPGWLVASVAGVASAYLLVYWLGRRPGARALAESGLFFVTLTTGIACGVWWLLFSGF